jgi:hypothetical protein
METKMSYDELLEKYTALKQKWDEKIDKMKAANKKYKQTEIGRAKQRMYQRNYHQRKKQKKLSDITN